MGLFVMNYMCNAIDHYYKVCFQPNLIMMNLIVVT